jgi:hypothetical protein
LRFLSSRSGITKIIAVTLIVVFASATVTISYYAITQLLYQNASPIPTPSPEPTVSPTPTSPYPTKPTPTPITTPTPTSSVHPTPTPTSELTTQEKIRDSTMSSIKSNHPETSQFTKDLIWTGGRVTPQNLVGAETFMYYSQGWNVTISYPVVPNAIYNIVADYSAPSVSIPYRIIWKGTWQNEVINETSYVFAQ